MPTGAKPHRQLEGITGDPPLIPYKGKIMGKSIKNAKFGYGCGKMGTDREKVINGKLFTWDKSGAE